MPKSAKSKPPVIRDLPLKRRFLELTENGYTPSRARKELGVAPALLTEWMRDPDFKLEYQAAYEAGSDRLEDEAYRRAHDGVSKPVFQQGECVGHVQEYSDTLMRDLLRARRPDKFRENAPVVNTNIALVQEPDDRELAKALTLLIAESKTQQKGNRNVS